MIEEIEKNEFHLDKQLMNLNAMYQFLERNMKYIENPSHFSHSVIHKLQYLFCLVKSKLYIYCLHDVIYDSIDISLDESIQIKYCSKCLLTF